MPHACWMHALLCLMHAGCMPCWCPCVLFRGCFLLQIVRAALNVMGRDSCHPLGHCTFAPTSVTSFPALPLLATPLRPPFSSSTSCHLSAQLRALASLLPWLQPWQHGLAPCVAVRHLRRQASSPSRDTTCQTPYRLSLAR